MRLVRDWRQAWRWLSVQALAISAAVPGAWLAIPEEWRAAMPAEWLAGAAVVIGLMGIIGRLVDQGGDDA